MDENAVGGDAVARQAFAIRVGECFGGAAQHLDDVARIEPAVCQYLAERRPPNEFHHRVHAALVLAAVEHARDVLLIELARGRQDLQASSAQDIGLPGRVQLDCQHLPTRADRFVDSAVPGFVQPRLDAIVTNLLG